MLPTTIRLSRKQLLDLPHYYPATGFTTSTNFSWSTPSSSRPNSACQPAGATSACSSIRAG